MNRTRNRIPLSVSVAGIVEKPSRYNPRTEGRTYVGNLWGARAAIKDMLRLRIDLWMRPRVILGPVPASGREIS
ncbi:MAG: hypothetical protein L0170_01445 [Acidobacteria bacterium]|nr:hypothetical protein [Acidobacteriota bacterium]